MQVQSKQAKLKENKKRPASVVEAVKRSSAIVQQPVKRSRAENREVLRCVNAPLQERTSELFPVGCDQSDGDCGMYAFEIHEYLRDLERRLEPDYMAASAADRGARRYALDWIVNAHRRYHLRADTLHRTISYFDHFVQSSSSQQQQQPIDNSTYQLVALGSLVVSSKYEETYIPSLDEFLYMADNSYDKDELIEFEQKLLVELRFELGHPTPIEFLRRASRIAGESEIVVLTYAQFLVELAFFEVELIRDWTPSQLASVAFYVSMLGHGRCPAWTPALAYHLQVSSDFVVKHSRDLCNLIDLVQKEYGCYSVYEKYSSAVMGRVGSNSYRATKFLRNNAFLNDRTQDQENNIPIGKTAAAAAVMMMTTTAANKHN